MAIPRKPIPKTQKQISIDQQQPSDPRFGNPNIPIPTQFNETGIDFNRSTKLSWKDDTSKPFSIGIKDIDEAVFYYFQNEIQKRNPLRHNSSRLNYAAGVCCI